MTLLYMGVFLALFFKIQGNLISLSVRSPEYTFYNLNPTPMTLLKLHI